MNALVLINDHFYSSSSLTGTCMVDTRHNLRLIINRFKTVFIHQRKMTAGDAFLKRGSFNISGLLGVVTVNMFSAMESLHDRRICAL